MILTPDTNQIIEESAEAETDGSTALQRDSLSDLRPQRWLQRWVRFCESFKFCILEGLIVLSKHSGRNPATTVTICVLVSTLLAGVGFATRFQIENEGSILFTPTGCNSLLHGEWIDSTESGFAQAGRDMQVFIHADGANILTREGVSRTFDILQTIRSTPGYYETCATDRDTEQGEDCPIESVTGFWDQHNQSAFESLTNTEEQLIQLLSSLQYANGEPVNRIQIFGNPFPPLPDHIMSASNNYILSEILLQSTTSFMMIVSLPSDEKAVAKFEQKVTDRLFALRDKWYNSPSNIYRMELQTQRSFDDEVLRGIQSDIPLMVMAFLIMGGFCALTLRKPHKVKSQTMLGLGAVTTIVLSIMSGYGLAVLCGVPFTSLVQIFPYVMVGIGLDDSFIITGAYARTNPNDSFETKIDQVMREVGVSITFSTLTTFFAFLLGGLASLPGIRWFAWYSAPTVMIDFAYQVTFFVALMAFDDKRQRLNRRDCCPCCSLAVTEDSFQKESDPTSAGRTPINRNAEPLDAALPPDSDETNRVTTDEVETGESTKFSAALSRWVDSYTLFLLRPAVKTVVLVVFAMLLALGAAAASRQGQEFDFRDLLPEDSYITEYYSALDVYFSGGVATSFLSGHCYFRDIDVSDQGNQDAMINFVQDMANLENVRYLPSLFWLVDFQSFVKNDTNIQQLEFNNQMDVFLTTEPYSVKFQKDVIRNEDNTITASRAPIQYVNVSLYDHKSQSDMLAAQKSIAGRQPLNEGLNANQWRFFSFGQIYYAWELYSVIVEEVLQMVAVGLVSVLILSLVFVPHPIGAITVTVVVAMIYVELVGFLHVVGISINSVSAIGLTMSIGLVVDYNTHIVMTYFDINAATRSERVKRVITTMGKSIMLGGFSTLLGVLPLSFSSSEIFRTFFFTFLGIVGFGGAHGLMFTPVVLSLIGPHPDSSCPLKQETESEANFGLGGQRNDAD